jgi:oxaloacetate decarboxylase gamma subunit
MSTTELVIEGFYLMLIGMGTVFLFLGLLVGAMRLMSHLVLRYAPLPVAAVRGGPSSAMASATASGADPNLPVVIAAAIAHYRNEHGPQGG